jgi:hypothetical protein
MAVLGRGSMRDKPHQYTKKLLRINLYLSDYKYMLKTCKIGQIISTSDSRIFFRMKGSCLKVHKIEIFFGFDFEICIISLLVMSKY